MKPLILLAAGLAAFAASASAAADPVWFCRPAPGPTFTDPAQCNSFCLQAQGGLLNGDDDRGPIYLCEIQRPPSGGGGGGGGGNPPIDFMPMPDPWDMPAPTSL